MKRETLSKGNALFSLYKFLKISFGFQLLFRSASMFKIDISPFCSVLCAVTVSEAVINISKSRVVVFIVKLFFISNKPFLNM